MIEKAVPVAEAKPEPPAPPPPVPDLPDPAIDPSKPDPWLDAKRPEAPAQPTRPADPPLAFDVSKLRTSPFTVEDMVKDVRGVAFATAKELVLVKIVGSYVNKTGEVDAKYGKLQLELQLLDGVDGVVDDPNRPTGAPITEVQPVEKTRDRCPQLTFAEGEWSLSETSCYKTRIKDGPRCTVAQIWSNAIAQGAPDNALAIVQFDARSTMWTFRITDKLRGVNFSRSYRDDCKATAPKPAAPSRTLPNPSAPRD